jgi:hypothetical protein
MVQLLKWYFRSRHTIKLYSSSISRSIFFIPF